MGAGVVWWLATVINVCCGQAQSGVVSFSMGYHPPVSSDDILANQYLNQT